MLTAHFGENTHDDNDQSCCPGDDRAEIRVN